jgi:hypothetical protein
MSPQFVSRYDARVDLVRKTIQELTQLDDKTAQDVAVRIVHVVDHVPESVR